MTNHDALTRALQFVIGFYVMPKIKSWV